MKALFLLTTNLLWLLLCSTGAAQQKVSSACILDTYVSGDIVDVLGVVSATPHGIRLSVPGCPKLVVVEDTSQLNEEDVKASFATREDENFKKLTDGLNASAGKKVTAALTGRLDVAAPVAVGIHNTLGILADSSGKQVGVYGFGHPAPIYKYRLVLQAVNSVTTD